MIMVVLVIEIIERKESKTTPMSGRGVGWRPFVMDRLTFFWKPERILKMS
jgi:hypothetical protein